MGYANINGIQRDADFKPIRERVEFKQLLLELDPKSAQNAKPAPAR